MRPSAKVTCTCAHCGASFERHRARAGRVRSAVERFWAKVDTSGACWPWTGAKNSDGYGHFLVAKGRWVLAHRFAWEQAHGPIPPDREVCHNCPTGDTPACVRPSHLFLGTHLDNMRDRDRKGRGRPFGRAARIPH